MGNNSAAWKNCKCGKRVRHLRKYQNDLLCYQCYTKKVTKIGTTLGKFKSKISLEQALNKVYNIDGYKYIDGKKQPRIQARNICVPSILIGHKVKFVLVDDE